MPADPELIPKVLQRWGKKLLGKLHRAFKVGGHQLHGGAPWVPLLPSTGIRLPLNVTGALAASVFVRVSGISVLVGSNSRIAIYHQNGTRSIPRRPVVEVTQFDLGGLMSELKRVLES